MLDVDKINRLIDVFPIRTLNKLNLLLTQMVGAGVTDIRSAQEVLQRYIEKKHIENKNEVRRAVNRKDRILSKKISPTSPNYKPYEEPELPLCPECGREKMRPVFGIKDKILSCPSCRYSEYLGSFEDNVPIEGVK